MNKLRSKRRKPFTRIITTPNGAWLTVEEALAAAPLKGNYYIFTGNLRTRIWKPKRRNANDSP